MWAAIMLAPSGTRRLANGQTDRGIMMPDGSHRRADTQEDDHDGESESNSRQQFKCQPKHGRGRPQITRAEANGRISQTTWVALERRGHSCKHGCAANLRLPASVHPRHAQGRTPAVPRVGKLQPASPR